MTETHRSATTWFLWPFKAIWDMLNRVLGLTSHLVAVILGIIIIIVGLVFTFFVVTVFIEIPLMIFDLMLMMRGIFQRSMFQALLEAPGILIFACHASKIRLS